MSTLDTKVGNHTDHHTYDAVVSGLSIKLDQIDPNGAKILTAAGFHPVDEYALLLWPSSGPTREVGLEEVVQLPRHGSPLEFIAVKADGVQYFVLDDQRYAWAGPLTLEDLTKVGRVPGNMEIWLDHPQQLLSLGQGIDLKHAGVERFHSREKVWELDVQGEITKWNHPDVIVRDALAKAGVDLNKPWTIVLKVKGLPPRQVELNDTIDLSQAGIERLWLRPKDVNNGEVAVVERRQFTLLSKDAVFLSQSGFRWEAVSEGRRWLIIQDYQLPQGYNVASCTIAIEIPTSYPAAQIDMFYCVPHLKLATGVIPPATEHREAIDGKSFQRWSRHRANGAWSPATDGVASHFGLIEESLCREVGV